MWAVHRRAIVQVHIQVPATAAHRVQFLLAIAVAVIRVLQVPYHLLTAAAVHQVPRGQVRIHRRATVPAPTLRRAIARPAVLFHRAIAVPAIAAHPTQAAAIVRQVARLAVAIQVRLIVHRVTVPAPTAHRAVQCPVRIRVLHTARRAIQVQAIQAAVRLFLRAIAVRLIAVLLTAQALIRRPVVPYPAATAHRRTRRRAVPLRQ